MFMMYILSVIYNFTSCDFKLVTHSFLQFGYVERMADLSVTQCQGNVPELEKGTN